VCVCGGREKVVLSWELAPVLLMQVLVATRWVLC
jgi:hypothetical protein